MAVLMHKMKSLRRFKFQSNPHNEYTYIYYILSAEVRSVEKYVIKPAYSATSSLHLNANFMWTATAMAVNAVNVRVITLPTFTFEKYIT